MVLAVEPSAVAAVVEVRLVAGAVVVTLEEEVEVEVEVLVLEESQAAVAEVGDFEGHKDLTIRSPETVEAVQRSLLVAVRVRTFEMGQQIGKYTGLVVECTSEAAIADSEHLVPVVPALELLVQTVAVQGPQKSHPAVPVQRIPEIPQHQIDTYPDFDFENTATASQQDVPASDQRIERYSVVVEYSVSKPADSSVHPPRVQ